MTQHRGGPGVHNLGNSLGGNLSECVGNSNLKICVNGLYQR